MPRASSAVRRTEHPHVVRVPGVLGGKPVIAGTRIPIWIIAERYKAADTVENIIRDYPQLTAAQVHDAISYYLDHREETEREIARQSFEGLRKEYDLRKIADGVYEVLGPKRRRA